jgi:hypothetical protein
MARKTQEDPWLTVDCPAGHWMRDDRDIKYSKESFLIRRSHLRKLYYELGGMLQHLGRREDQTEENCKLFNAMANTLRVASGNLGGAPRSNAKRCPCGQMTAYRAKVRYHYCTRKGPVPSPRDLRRVASRKAQNVRVR